MSFKSGFVSIIGIPNVGKSTILNYYCGEKIAIVSPKPQTTRNVIRGIITENDYQVIFMDTPGIHKVRNKLGEYMVTAAEGTLGDVDCVVLVADTQRNEIRSTELSLIEKLKKLKAPVILAVNKIDKEDKANLLPFIEKYSELMNFTEIIPVSARNGDGMELLKQKIIERLPEGPMLFPPEYITDKPEKFLCAEYIREAILKYMRDELPHGTGVEIDSFKERPSGTLVDIEATIYCEKSSHKSMLIGKNGEMLKKIGSESRRQMERMLDCKVFLQLWVKVKDGWRDNNNVLRDLGYIKE